MKRLLFLLSKLSLVVFLLVATAKTFAQLPNIAIINMVDSTIIHKHLGLTMFTNKVDTFNLKFNCQKYIDQELTKFLSPKYTVSFITIPDTLLFKCRSIFGFWGLKKTFKPWLASLKDKYDFVIYVEPCRPGGGIQGPTFQTNQTFWGSGLYSHGNPIKSSAFVYSSIVFFVYRTSNQVELEYYAGYKSSISQIKGYKFSDDRMSIDPEMLPVIKTGLVKLLDDKIEMFLTRSFLVPKDVYDEIKLSKAK
jgi:hypothetical protein